MFQITENSDTKDPTECFTEEPDSNEAVWPTRNVVEVYAAGYLPTLWDRTKLGNIIELNYIYYRRKRSPPRKIQINK